jgi:hypothetical protein
MVVQAVVVVVVIAVADKKMRWGKSGAAKVA